jgi:Cu/Ag efflux protein CusF
MDQRFLLAVLCAIAAACSGPAAPDSSKEPVRRYQLHGEVIRLEADGRIADIKHEKIGDWMEAMTMGFPVKDQKEFESLHAGEKIYATVFVQGLNYWIGEVREDK